MAGKMKLEVGYETYVFVSVSMPYADFDAFEEACEDKQKQPVDVLQQLIYEYIKENEDVS